MRTEFPECQCIVGAVNDRPEGYGLSGKIRFEDDEKELEAYRRAADFFISQMWEIRLGPARVWIYGGAGREPPSGLFCASKHAGR